MLGYDTSLLRALQSSEMFHHRRFELRQTFELESFPTSAVQLTYLYKRQRRGSNDKPSGDM